MAAERCQFWIHVWRRVLSEESTAGKYHRAGVLDKKEAMASPGNRIAKSEYCIAKARNDHQRSTSGDD